MIEKVKSSLLERIMGIEWYVTDIPHYLSLEIKLNSKSFHVYEVHDNIITLNKSQVTKTLGLSEQEKTYTYLLLEKKDIDTIQALNEISRKLNIPFNSIGYSGLKDANSTSYQLISIPSKYLRRYSVGDVIKISDKIVLKIMGFSDKPVTRNLHKGNYFKIAFELNFNLRDRVEKALNTIKLLKHYPNYYGLQRFGTRRPITHLIGKYIIRREWDKAVKCIISYPFSSEDPLIRKARILAEENRIGESINIYPRKHDYEWLILKYASEDLNSLAILRRIPRQYIKLFINAYQSYLFNLILSKIIEYYDTYTKTIDGMNECTSPLGDLRPCIQVVGLNMNINSRSKLYEIIKEILSIEGVRIDYFNVKELKVKAYSWLRPVYIPVINFKWRFITKNNRLLTTMSFILERGAYATNILRELANRNIDKIYN